MCGIAGLIGPGARDPAIVAAMTRQLEHRGPDDEGLWSDPEAGVAFGHRRLSIVDLSPAGHEPMASASGRLIVTFNGEIYNHAEIRARLEAEGRAPPGGWRGHSDIETFLEAIEHWGLERALEAAAGMFAFALWDCSERSLRLVRDRFGEKPLYYARAGGDFLFASELKAIVAHPAFDRTVDSDALAVYLRRLSIPAPFSIYRDAAKLTPGSILTIAVGSEPVIAPYWDYGDVVRNGAADRFNDEREAIAAIDDALAIAIKGQAMADVPVGAFLSGGIDSSTVAALYQRHHDIPIRTFSIGFAEVGFNEASDAARVASALGTVHRELYVSPEDALAVIPQLPRIYDEPFGDSSQIPTFILSRFARADVKVALTGDGGDEMFGGYNRHIMLPRLWDSIGRMPRWARCAALAPLGLVSDRFLPGGQRHGYKSRKALQLAAQARGFEDLAAGFIEERSFASRLVTSRPEPAVPSLGRGHSTLDRLTYLDSVTYLPDDILCKVDRASMAVGLETRLPFLDHRVAAVAARVPPSMKVRGTAGKVVLKSLLANYLPREMFSRPKAGFTVPIDAWLRGPLREWAGDLLAPGRLRRQGLVDSGEVAKLWQSFQAGNTVNGAAMWALIMLEAWAG